MNAAGDKENKPIQINGANQEVVPQSSAMGAETNERTASQNLNGNSPQNSDCNNLPITNGAYPKLNSIPCSTSCEPSTSRKSNLVQIPCGTTTNLQNDTTCKEIELGSQTRNNLGCHSAFENSNVTQQKPQRNQTCNYEGSSSSEDEECCIYTYKGDSNQMADLPSSFFRLDLMPSRQHPNSRNSSPDMDYLEMDFDPGPSNDRDSSSGSEFDGTRHEEELFLAEAPSFSQPQPSCEPTPEPPVESDFNSPTPLTPLSTPSPIWSTRPQSSTDRPNSSGLIWSPPLSPQRLQKTSEAESEPSRSSYCYCASNTQSCISIDENFNNGDSGTMIWKEQEAKEKQVTQIVTSACGATVVLNTLLALNVPCTVSTVKQCMNTRLRLETGPIPEYLFSRSNAGATHADVIQGLQSASQDQVFARFFQMYPQRSISLTNLLSYWIRKGAVPILTLNPQQDSSSSEVADCWRHQMVHGVSARGVHLTDPVDVQTEAGLRPQLSCPSELRVGYEDVLSRWTPDTDLSALIDPALPLWRRANVLGQVVNVIREGKSRNHSRTHVTIPAAYSSGVTLAMLRSNPACDELRLAPELPLDPFADR